MIRQLTPCEALDLLQSKGISFQGSNTPSAEALFMLLLTEQGCAPKFTQSFFQAVCAVALAQEKKKRMSKTSRELDQLIGKLNALTDDDLSLIDPVKSLLLLTVV